MGERVYAEFAMYPYDATALGTTPAGAAVLDAIEELLDVHEYTQEKTTPGLLDVSLFEVNYGTAHFDEMQLATLATTAGLFYRQSDEGGSEWDSLVTICAPGHTPFTFSVAPASGAVLLSASDIAQHTKPGVDLPESLDAFFTLAGMDLPAWAEAAATGELDRLLALV